MTYRDELAQAHERIDRLEAELRDERAKNAAPPPPPPPPKSPGPSMRVVVAVVVVSVLLGGVAGFFALRAPPRPLVLEPVDKVLRDPRRYEGVRMRIQGELVKGTTKRGGEPCEMRLFIQRDGLMMPVHMGHCLVSDLYRDETGIRITAEGALGSDGTFEAEQIMVAWTTTFPGIK